MSLLVRRLKPGPGLVLVQDTLTPTWAHFSPSPRTPCGRQEWSFFGVLGPPSGRKEGQKINVLNSLHNGLRRHTVEFGKNNL